MSETDVSTPVAAAVFAGAAILVGLPGTALALRALSALLDVLGISITLGATVLDSLVGFAFAVGVLSFWLQISYEVAQLRLYGVSALSRGSRVGTLARYLVVWAAVLAAVVFLVVVGVFSALALFSSQPTVGLAGLVTALAGIWVFARAGLAFRAGFEGTAG